MIKQKASKNIEIQAIMIDALPGINEPMMFDVPYLFTNGLDFYILPDKIPEDQPWTTTKN